MPSKSRAQQRLFGIALGVRRGEIRRSDVTKEVLAIVDSNMTNREIEHFTTLKNKHLSDYIKESLRES